MYSPFYVTIVIRRLNRCGYTVLVTDACYIVEHVNNIMDRSTIPTFTQLVAYMLLMERAAAYVVHGAG